MSDVAITMPQLGETVAEGTVSRWLVEPGTTVQAEQPVLEVSTDKVDTEVVAPVSGTVREIAVPEGETVAVGTVLAMLQVSPPGGPSEVPDTDLTEESPSTAQPHTPGPRVETRRDSRSRRHLASPRVRRLARDEGVDLTSVRPTGPHGRTSAADVLAASHHVKQDSPRVAAPITVPETDDPGQGAASPVADRQASPRGHFETLSRRRRVIAERMQRSLQETAQLTTVVEADLTRVEAARDSHKDAFRWRYGVGLSILPFVAAAAVRALAEHPVINAELDLARGIVTYPSTVGLGVAVDTSDGLVVPVVGNADDLTVGGLARRIAELAARSRNGSATPDDYAGGTFTITNTGSRGALFDTPSLNPPQAAILGLGALVRRPVALIGQDGDELIAVRSMAYLALTYDHRLVDRDDAARYLSTLKQHLEAPGHSWSSALGLKETT